MVNIQLQDMILKRTAKERDNFFLLLESYGPSLRSYVTDYLITRYSAPINL